MRGQGKPERTSIRYGMKLFHHGTRNRHGMSTHPQRIHIDANLPICTTSVCAVYVPLPCSNCRLHIPIRTQTVLSCSGSGLSTQALQRNAWLGKRLPIALDTTMHPETLVQCPNWTNRHFFQSELLIFSNLELTFCNDAQFKRFSQLFRNAN